MLGFLESHWFTLLWIIAVVVVVPIGWHWFKEYKYTAAIAVRIEAAEGSLWKIFVLHLEGAKTTVLCFIGSALATAKDWANSTFHTVFGLTPNDLDPFKDSTLLHSFFADGTVLKVIAALTFFGAFLSIKGKLFAAQLMPAPGSAPPAV